MGIHAGADWLPIHTAPRGPMTPVLAWREGWELPQWVHWCENPRTGTTFWNDWFEHDVYDNETEPPTHWWPVAPWPGMPSAPVART